MREQSFDYIIYNILKTTPTRLLLIINNYRSHWFTAYSCINITHPESTISVVIRFRHLTMVLQDHVVVNGINNVVLKVIVMKHLLTIPVQLIISSSLTVL